MSLPLLLRARRSLPVICHGSAVTDAGVLSLGAMQQLKVLLLGRTAVSAEAMSELQASLPDLVFTEAT